MSDMPGLCPNAARNLDHEEELCENQPADPGWPLSARLKQDYQVKENHSFPGLTKPNLIRQSRRNERVVQPTKRRHRAARQHTEGERFLTTPSLAKCPYCTK